MINYCCHWPVCRTQTHDNDDWVMILLLIVKLPPLCDVCVSVCTSIDQGSSSYCISIKSYFNLAKSVYFVTHSFDRLVDDCDDDADEKIKGMFIIFCHTHTHKIVRIVVILYYFIVSSQSLKNHQICLAFCFCVFIVTKIYYSSTVITAVL